MSLKNGSGVAKKHQHMTKGEETKYYKTQKWCVTLLSISILKIKEFLKSVNVAKDNNKIQKQRPQI